MTKLSPRTEAISKTIAHAPHDCRLYTHGCIKERDTQSKGAVYIPPCCMHVSGQSDVEQYSNQPKALTIIELRIENDFVPKSTYYRHRNLYFCRHSNQWLTDGESSVVALYCRLMYNRIKYRHTNIRV